MKSAKPGTLQESIFEAVLLAVNRIVPANSAALRSRVLDRIDNDIAQSRFITTVPASDGDWTELLPCIRAKRVYTDGIAESWLVRLQPGARAPAHDHPAAEECIVLEGSIRYRDGSTLHAGDYEVVQPGAHHSELVSDAGALVFLRYGAPLSQFIAL